MMEMSREKAMVSGAREAREAIEDRWEEKKGEKLGDRRARYHLSLFL